MPSIVTQWPKTPHFGLPLRMSPCAVSAFRTPQDVLRAVGLMEGAVCRAELIVGLRHSGVDPSRQVKEHLVWALELTRPRFRTRHVART